MPFHCKTQSSTTPALIIISAPFSSRFPSLDGRCSMETPHLGLSAPRPLTLCPLSSVLWASVLMSSRVSPRSSGWSRTDCVDQVRMALHSENSACSCPLSPEGKGVCTHAQPLWIIELMTKIMSLFTGKFLNSGERMNTSLQKWLFWGSKVVSRWVFEMFSLASDISQPENRYRPQGSVCCDQTVIKFS